MRINSLEFMIDNKEIIIDMSVNLINELQKMYETDPNRIINTFSDTFISGHYELVDESINIFCSRDDSITISFYDPDCFDKVNMKIRFDNEYISVSDFIKVISTMVNIEDNEGIKKRAVCKYDNYEVEYSQVDCSNVIYNLLVLSRI